MPNYWVAVGALAATGPRSQRRMFRWWTLAAMATGIVFAALMRPSDAFWLVLGLLICALVLPGWYRWRTCAAIVGAGALGAMPWIIEAYTGYGGLLHRLQQASAIQGGLHLQEGFRYALRAVNGPLLCRPCSVAGTPWHVFLGLPSASRS